MTYTKHRAKISHNKIIEAERLGWVKINKDGRVEGLSNLAELGIGLLISKRKRGLL